MKYFYTLLLIAFFSLNTFSQDSLFAPIDHQITKSNNFYEQINLFENYWKNKDKNKKGSGYKVFKRWEELWKGRVLENGTIFTSQMIADQWNETQNDKKSNLISGSNWTSLGPFTNTNNGSYSNGQGRVNKVVVDPSNPNRIYVGTPNGGLWKSENNGNSWIPLTDFLPVIGISGIAIDYNNSNIIYISTGDRDGNNSSSNGIYKSINGGITWNQINPTLSSYYTTGEIKIHPTNSNILWFTCSEGFFKTTNGGSTWTKTINSEVFEFRLKPNNPDVLYVITSNYPGKIAKSIDGGNTFTEIINFNINGRTLIDVTPSNPEALYVVCADSSGLKGFYKSNNSGSSFSLMNNTTNIIESSQAFYDLTLAVSPQNENLIFVGCLNIWKSVNGGTTWNVLNDGGISSSINYTHWDIHDLKFFNSKLYCGSDGGIYISNDDGNTFTDKTKNGLIISQFYRIDVAPQTTTKIVGGLQDNGGYAYYNNNWTNFHGADGMDAAINPINPNICYSFMQNGSGLYSFNSSTNTSSFVANNPNNDSGYWITPLESSIDGNLYAAYVNGFYKLNGTSWQQICNLPQGLTIETDPTNANRILVASTNFNFYQVLKNGTNYSYTQLTSPNPTNDGHIVSIAINDNNPNIIYAVTNLNIFKSINGGLNWTNINYNLDTNIRKNAIAYQKNSLNNSIYLATSNCIYYLDDTSNQWLTYNTNLPHTNVTDIEVNSVEGNVVAATYGRGIWRSPVATESLIVEEYNNISEKPLVYPNPTKDFLFLNISINEKCQINIYSIDGKLLFKADFESIMKDSKINIGNIASGTHILIIKSENHLITKKIIINNLN